MAKQLGDGPIEMSMHDLMNSLASGVDLILNGRDAADGKAERKNGFVLLVFPFEGFDGRANYISNGASRADIVTLFKEQIARFEQQIKEQEDAQGG
jgi:hypothetical protein